MVQRTGSTIPRYIRYLNPTLIVFGINIVSLLLFLAIPEDFMQSFSRTPKYVSISGIFSYIVFFIAFTIGSLKFESCDYKNAHQLFALNTRYKKLLSQVVILFFIIVLIGYLFWFKDVILNIQSYIAQVFNSGILSISEQLKEQASIKTLTNFGIGTVIFSYICYRLTLKKLYLRIVITLLIFSLFRVVFTAERIAIIELIIPIGVLIIRFNPELVKKLSFILLLIFIIVWSTELIRSYMSPMYNSTYSPFQFLIFRFSMYFTTSINNFQLLLNESFPQDFLPVSLRSFRNLFHLDTNTSKTLNNLLINNANPEYNNFTAWGELLIDFGWAGPVVALIIGRISRLFYQSFVKGNIVGLMVYPLLILFFVQSFRTLQIVNIRFYATYIMVLIFLFLKYLARRYPKQS